MSICIHGPTPAIPQGDVDALLRRPLEGEGWRVLLAGLARARTELRDRLVGAYALGSLAHGGFVAATSDVDLALLIDSMDDDPAAAMDAIRRNVASALDTPLAGRLSLFWSSWTDLRNAAPRGRFPLVDRIDLAAAGRWLYGEDRRSHIALPTGADRRSALVIEAAEFMLHRFETSVKDAVLRDPSRLIALGCREVTKAVLFPVRFLYTAATGLADGNAPAVAHFVTHAEASLADLATAASNWRDAGRLPSEKTVAALLRTSLLPLYRELIATYAAETARLGHHTLSQSFRSWSDQLGSPL